MSTSSFDKGLCTGWGKNYPSAESAKPWEMIYKNLSPERA